MNSTDNFQKTSAYLFRQNFEEQEQLLFHTLYIPKNQPISAILLVLHGMQEHGGKYADMARFFAKRGYAVLTYDQIRHGKTAKNHICT